MNSQLLMRAARIICTHHEDTFSGSRVIPRPDGGGIIHDPWTVAKDPTIAVTKKRIKWGCDGHDLASLAGLAGVDVSSCNSLIEHLTEAVLWRGKYPVDTSGSHIYGPDFLNFGGSHVWGDSKNQIEKTYGLVAKHIGK